MTFKDGAGTVTKVVEFDYDVFNRRIAKRVDDDGDGTVDRSYRFVYDSSGKLDPGTGVPLDDVVLVFEDPDGSGSEPFALCSRLLHGPAIDQIFASESATGEILWALADHQGTVRDWVEYDPATDTTTVVHHLKYDSFGRITAIEDGSGNSAALSPPLSALSYSCTGRVWDADAELYFYRARWYDPTTGRFISEDPLGFAAGDLNVSRYVFNNTVNLTDPSGLDGFVGSRDLAPPPAENNSGSPAEEPPHAQHPDEYITPFGPMIACVPRYCNGRVVGSMGTVGSPPTVPFDWHYDRNRFNNPPPTRQEARAAGWELQPPERSIYHQHGFGHGNVKYLSPDRHDEAVYDSEGNLVTDPANLGTYNYGTDDFSHFFRDVLPYWIYGNSEDDPTPVLDRIGGPGTTPPAPRMPTDRDLEGILEGIIGRTIFPRY